MYHIDTSESVELKWATCSTAAIQNSDFWFHEDGETVFIDGYRGAPLHIDYIGVALTKSLKIKITSSNPHLKVSPSTCTFTHKNHYCRLSVHNAKLGEKVYGVNQFTVTEVGASQGPLQAQTASDTGAVGFGVGVQEKGMPEAMRWWSGVFKLDINDNREGVYIQNGRVIVANSTNKARDYQSPFWSGEGAVPYEGKTSIFTLPSGQVCYLDQGIALDHTRPYYPPSRFDSIEYISDITTPSDPIYNGPIVTGNYNITTCSANGVNSCASNKWDSWTLGLANLSGKDLDSNVFKAGEIQILKNNTWDNGTTLYYKVWNDGSWLPYSVGLILIQGSFDGSRFDPYAAAPSILEVQSAPPCSYYLKPDQNVTYSVQVKAFGPGTITMPQGGQCQKYSNQGQEFTYCTGGGYKNSWYEVSAVPDAGKTFKGWYSSGLCDDKSTTCRFQLTSDVTLSPNFQ